MANWKMNPTSESAATELARNTDISGVVIIPPFPFIQAIGSVLKNAALGAQNVFWENSGAYTGEVSPIMLKGLGVSYVIIGHSERRKYFKETDEIISKKVKIAIDSGLNVILCVGENEDIRKNGTAASVEFVEKQLEQSIMDMSKNNTAEIIIAYEPVWAIGTGKNATPEDAEEMAEYIKKVIKRLDKFRKPVRVLYGGSVSQKNARGLSSGKNIGGFLVGGASLNAQELRGVISETL